MSTTAVNNPISDRINAMSESATIAMAQAARDLASKGANVINLSVGEPDFMTPDYIKEAAKKAIDDGYSFYTPVPGYPELKKAISNKLNKENNIDCAPENIVVSTGAKQSLANVILSLINPGDEVIILAPYWVTYADLVKLAEGVPVILEGKIENDFKVPASQIEDAITSKTKAIMFSSPSNPAGALLGEAECNEIADVIDKHDDIYVIADEIYEYINYIGGHFSIGSIPKIKDRVITINGFSKGFAMTGWRVGYMAAPVWMAKACNKIQGQVTSGTCSIAQRACITALEDEKNLAASSSEMREAFERRRDLIINLLDKIPGVETNVPEGAFYIYPKVSSYFGKKTESGDTIENASDLSLYLLNVAHVSTVTGVAFGAPEHIRISFAASDDNITEAIERISKALANLS